MIILSDNNLRGAVEALRQLVQLDWAEYIAAYDLEFKQLEDVGLNARSPDREIYLKCLELDAVLMTSDKATDDGEESLESAIRSLCRKDSPPVITIGNQVRVLKDADYQRQCVYDLIDCVSDVDRYRGIGRVYVPSSWRGTGR